MQPITSPMRNLALLSLAALFACGGSGATAPASSYPPVHTPPVDGSPGDPPGDQGDAGSPVDDDGGTVDPGSDAGSDAGTPADSGTATPSVPSFNGLASGAVVSGHVGLNAQVPDGTARV